jgi:hypothetical protein
MSFMPGFRELFQFFFELITHMLTVPSYSFIYANE